MPRRIRWERATVHKVRSIDHFTVKLTGGYLLTLAQAQEIIQHKLKSLHRRNDIKNFSIRLQNQAGETKDYPNIDTKSLVEFQYALTSGEVITRSDLTHVQHQEITFTKN